MRILMVNYEYPPLGGGGGIAHQDVAEALAERHEISMLTTQYHGLPTKERRRGISITRVPVWGRTSLPTASIRSMVTFAPAALAVGLRLARAFRPDVIHAFFAVPSGLPAVLLGRLTGTPVMLTLVGADIFDPNPTAGIATHRNPVLRAVVSRVIRAADRRTAISHDTKARAIEYHGAPSDIEVVPLGLVKPARDPVRRLPRTSEGGVFRLVAIGRLIPRKAYHDLLEALALLHRSNVHLDLIGDGPLGPSLKEAAERLGIAHLVTFHGSADEAVKWRLLEEADCFVSASLYEGFGIVFLEAMYAGLPMVATDQGGHTDFLSVGENALLVPPRKPAQLAAAIKLLLQEDALRARMGEANARKVQTLTISSTAARYEELLENLRTKKQPLAVRAKVEEIAKAFRP